MSKQDRQGVRTATQLEQKYGFGESFAELYGLVEKVEVSYQTAIKELDEELDAEGVFNRLTNYGEDQGLYRENGKIYINAEYIKSGKLAAEYIDADNLEVKAANITGTLDASEVTISNLSATSITGGTLDASKVTISNLSASVIKSGILDADLVTINNLTVTSANISSLSASKISGGTLNFNNITVTNLSASDISGGTIDANDVSIINLDASSIDTSTLYATQMKGGTVSLVNSSEREVGSIDITGSSSSSFAISLNSGGALSLYAEYGDLYAEAYGSITLASDNVRVYNCSQLSPSGSINTNLGNSGARFGTVYANTGTINTSDRRLKNNIEALPEKYLTMLAAVTPRRYKIYDSTSDRYHVGFISQEVEEAMALAGVTSQEFGGFVKGADEDGNDIYMLRYEEFIAILLAAIQNQEARIKALEAR